MKIKGINKAKCMYYGKIERKSIEKELIIENKQEDNNQNVVIENTNCFALVVVRKLPWYKKLVKSIRNFFVIYNWRKAR